MASLTQWTWVWVNSGSLWWTGRPGVLRFMGLQRVRYDWATELNWTEGGSLCFRTGTGLRYQSKAYLVCLWRDIFSKLLRMKRHQTSSSKAKWWDMGISQRVASSFWCDYFSSSKRPSHWQSSLQTPLRMWLGMWIEQVLGFSLFPFIQANSYHYFSRSLPQVDHESWAQRYIGKYSFTEWASLSVSDHSQGGS